jgi:RNA-binding protein Musashi
MESIDPLKLFIGGLSWETDEAKLQAYFSQFGTLTAVEIKRDAEDKLDPSVKRHRGFGFVTYESPESVAKVLHQPIHMLDSKKIDPKPAEIKSAMKPLQPAMHPMSDASDGSSNGCEKKIFIGGIGNSTVEDNVKEYFRNTYNIEVVEVEFKYDKATQRMRGFGFVTFESVEQVDRVVQKRFHEINGKSVEVKRAQPRHATPSGQAYAQMQQAQRSGSAYAAAYQAYSQTDYRTANGQQYQQPFYGAGQGYYGGYGAAAQAAGYGQYGSTNTNYSYDASAYSRTQTSTGDRQDTQSYYQQPYGHGGAQPLAASYGQDASSYTGRSAYGGPQDSYGPPGGGYPRGGGQQQQPRYGGYGH